MSQILARQGRSLLALVAVLAIAVAACGSSSGTADPGSSSTAGATASPGATAVRTSGGAFAGDEAFANIDNYKFKMTIQSETIAGSLASLTGGSVDKPVVIEGTVIVKPEAAAAINVGPVQIVEMDGQRWVNPGIGIFVASPIAPGDSMIDSLTPGTLFGQFLGSVREGDFDIVGTEEKNGVQAVHWKANEATAARIGAGSGIEGATWTSDAWVATDAGYPVAFALIGMKDGEVRYQIVFDLTNVNDPANKVQAPRAAS